MSSIRSRLAGGAFAVVLLLLHACGGSDSGTGPTEDPSIAASVSPTSATVRQGETTTFTVNVVRTEYDGAIGVAVAGLPSGVTVAPVTLPASQSSAQVTVTASLDAATGTHPLTVTASGTGVPSVTGTFELTVTEAPRVALALATSTLAVEQGESGSVGVTVARSGGFDGAVAVSVSGLPSGLTAGSITIAAGATEGTLSITAASDAPLGTGTATVAASGDGVPDATASLSVEVRQGDAITLAATPAELTVAQGASGEVGIGVTRLSGFAGEVTFAATGVPEGVAVTFDPPTTSGDATTATVEVGASVAPGSYSWTVTGSADGIADAATTVALVVTEAPEPTIGVALSPASLTVQGGASGTATVQLSRAGGFTGAIDLAVSGGTDGIAPGFDLTTVTGDQATLNVAVAPTVPAGDYTLVVTASGDGVADATATLSLTVTAAPTIGLSLSAGTLSVEQAQNGSVGVTIDRTGGFTGEVDLAVSGAPNGVTATITAGSGLVGADGPSTVPVSGSSATIAIAASASTTPGTYTLAVTASASGVATATANLTLTITAAPVTGDSYTWSFCPTAPSWFAVKNEGAEWTEVTSNTGDFTFVVSGNTVAVAWTIVSSGKPTTYLRYAHKDELDGLGSSLCNGPKSLDGNVVGIVSTNQGYLSAGGASAVVTASNNGMFSLSNVRSGPIDVFGSRVELGFSGGAVTNTPNRFFIQRGIEPADGSTIDIDFTGGTSFAPQAQDVGATNLNEPALMTMVYRSTGNTAVLYTQTSYTSGPFWTYHGVPAAQQAEGDFHLLTLTTQPSNGTTGAYRSASVYFRTIQDQEVAFGAAIGATTFTTTETSPYLRPRIQYTRQSDYDRYWYVSYQQGDRTVQAYITDGWQGASDIDFTVPDFSAVSGWMNEWGLQTTGDITFAFVTSGWDAEGALAPASLAEGLGIRTATRTGTITP